MITFDSLVQNHLPLLHTWLNEPHVQEWWDKGAISLEDVEKKYLPRIKGEYPVSCFVFSADQRPAGMVQCYWLKDFPEYSSQLCLPIADTTASVDIFVGDRGFLHRGVGSQALKEFLQDYVFEGMGASECLISPSVDNAAAIKAYGKAGFKHVGTVLLKDTEQGEYLMKVTRDDFGCVDPLKGCAF